MSCSDSKKSKKRKSSKSGNMGDVLGKECGDGEKDEMPQETCGEDVREEADGAPSGDEQSSQSSGDPDNYDIKRSDELKEEMLPEEAVTVLSAAALANASQREEKPCSCEACKDRREHAAEQLEEMRRLQSYWMELRQYIRMVYRMVMEGHSIENEENGECDPRMKDLVQKLCARDPHQLFQRLEAQVQEFVIEAKVRQLELVREQQIPELAQIFLTGLLDGYEKLCAAAKQLTPLLQPLEIHHLQRFNISWEVLNKHLYQSCVYTDHSVQNNLPLYIGQLRNMLPGKNEAYSELVHRYLAFDDEMTLIGAMWRDAETLIDSYNNEEATRKAKQRMLREDLELFKVQRKLFQQQQQQQPKHGREQRDYGDPLPTLTNLGGPTSGPGPGSLRDSPEDETGNNGYCPGCSTRRGCPCDDCAVTHILTCGVTPPDSPLPIYSHRLELQQEYRVEAEGSEQPLDSPSEPDLISADGAASGDVEGADLAASQQQSCECHVCTAPLMTPMDLMESYECHSCVQQGVPIPGSTPAVNLNLHAGGFHLYPHIHGTGGGGDASSLYPHIYNYQSLLTQLGPKHSRMGVHMQEQLQLTTSPTETKTSHLLQSQLVSPSPSSASSVSDLLPPGMTLEPLPASSSPPHMAVAASSSPGASGFSTPPPAIPEGSPQSLPIVTSVPQTRKQPSPTGSALGSVAKDSVPPAGTVKQQVVPTSCREHTKPPLQSLQSSASTQTSPNKAKSQQQPKSSVVTVATITRTQLSQSVVKRGPATTTTTTTQHPVPASSPPATAARTVPSNGNSVRHSTTQTANHSHTSSHQPLPDVVKSAATSTTPTQHRTAPASSKVPAHSCHKNLKNVGSIEPIKRVACTDYPDSEAADLEDSSSQDDTCSERSSSTTTSTQRDSRHCDCCYCEVFGHGMPSVAPVSRNYQEMRERLRLLLTKKKAKCKIGGVPPSSVGNGNPVQPSNTAPPTSPEATGKPSGCQSGAPVAPPPPAASGSTAPVLAKQDSVDSLPQSNVKDPRDLEALLDFIEGNQSSRCKDAKKAAKKARQKQKKLEEKERKDQEEAERLRLEELQNKTPEVTITVVNTPQQQQQPQGKSGKKKSGADTKNKAEKSPTPPAAPSQQPSPAVAPVTSTQSSSPQMVTIKRVMETNGAEPTVTITLKGATPDKDKVLFTLVNGQVCQAQENVKATSQQQPSGNQNNSSKNGNVNSKKKNKKGNSGNAPRNPSNASGGKTVHSTAKNGSVMKPSNAANGASGNNSKQNCNNNGANKSGAAQQKQRPSSAVVLNDSVSEISPLARTPYLKQLSSSASVQINNVINNMSSGKSGSVGATQKLKSESNNVVGNRSFSLENLKLPPGITITKVDGPSSASLRKTQTKTPAENPKPASPMMPNHSSTTIIAAPMVGGGPNKTVGYSTAVSQTLSGSNVIVVDTGKMKEADSAVTNGDDAAHGGNSSKKKNKKKNKNPDNAGNTNKVQRQQQVSNGVTMTVKHPNGVQASKSMNPPQQQNGSVNIKVPQSPVHPLLSKHSIRPQALNTQPAIIKVNGAMVTIRNPALQQAMASASGSRFPPAQRPEVMVNGGPKQPPSNKPGKKSGTPPASGAKGKENTSTVPPRFANAESNAAAAAAMLRNRLASDCNGLNGLHISKVNNSPPDGIALRGSANGLPPRMMRPQQQQQQQQQQQKVGVMQNGPSHPQENSMPPSHSSMARTMMQNQSAMREAMAAANEAKKKKKKKKGAGGQGHADDWNLVESVFAPKDIDLENGDIDDDERELEAFKRFCFNSVPPKRKEKVHLNIKDIVLKKKSSAIGCS